MTGLTARRGLLLALAQHLRPRATADITDGILLVSTDTWRIEIEVFTNVEPDTPLTIVYRNVRTCDEYGSIATPEAAATAILDELEGRSDGG